MSPILISVFFAVVGAIGLLMRPMSARSEASRRHATRIYSNLAMLLVFRAYPITAPVFGCASALLAIAAIIPRPTGTWLVVPAMALFALGLFLTYWPPNRIVPRWLRLEIAAGKVQQARPDVFDWLVLAFAGPLFLFAPFGAIALLITGSVPPG